ncbi:alpha/beta hydrolase [Virgibacillus sp. C22-A2]|uniref:Alpha/beta hydrolase n=1 Tax=Virgibacillus tibetensis TaxID=3042313 RepID=A0ABU6KIF2_9BACI|nr:alpha/beta hydrolase [Virgibacillus sp. C22-A2]
MKKQILFIHSAGPQGNDQGSNDLVAFLQEACGADYNIIHPKMPDSENPIYELWREQLKNEIELLDGHVILIGHSLGGSVLLKYLSEEGCRLHISGLITIAAPYWGKDDNWQREDFTLSEDFASNLARIAQLVMYHSRNDEIVPFAHVEHYAKNLPQAIIRALEGGAHLFHEGIHELIKDIRSL